MTLRPFKLIYNAKKYKKNSNKYSSTSLYYVQDHRGQRLNDETPVPKGNKFWNKLLSHPITAFGYEIQFQNELKDLPNPKFDKFQVIKALDFWIEYFVYQNKCDYILEGTVSTEFELHLEELIRVREAVLKESSDTKYVRQKIRPNIPSFEREYYLAYMGKDGKSKKHKPDMKQIIEFTENVLDTSNSPFSTVDQFCYKVKTMTRKEYEDTIKKIPEQAQKAVNSISSDMSRILSSLIQTQLNFNFEDNFRDDENRWSFGTLTNRTINAGENTIVGTAGEALRPGDLVVVDENGRFRRATPFDPSESLTTLSDVRFTSTEDTNSEFIWREVPATAQSITVQDDDEEDEEEWNPERDGTPMN